MTLISNLYTAGLIVLTVTVIFAVGVMGYGTLHAFEVDVPDIVWKVEGVGVTLGLGLVLLSEFVRGFSK